MINGSFYCYDNKLTSLEGSPEIVKGNFTCSRNKKKFTKDEVKKHCKVKGIIYA